MTKLALHVSNIEFENHEDDARRRRLAAFPERFATTIIHRPPADPVSDNARLTLLLAKAGLKLERLRRSVRIAAEQIVRAGELLREKQARIDALEQDKAALIAALHRASRAA